MVTGLPSENLYIVPVAAGLILAFTLLLLRLTTTMTFEVVDVLLKAKMLFEVEVIETTGDPKFALCRAPFNFFSFISF
jgi:hypothetical protein